MERNKLLELASIICRIAGVLQVAGIVIATIVLIHWHIDREFYREVKLSEKGNVSFQMATSETDGSQEELRLINRSNEPFQIDVRFSDLTPATINFNFLQIILVLAFIYLIFKEFGAVIRSVQDFQTFRADNIASFRKIGKYFLIIFLFSGFHFISTRMGDTTSAKVSYDFDATPLILMLVAYVLAEIFKEGNRLYEEEQLTV